MSEPGLEWAWALNLIKLLRSQRHDLEERVEKLAVALNRQCDNMAFIINHACLPDAWYEKFKRELEEDR